MSIAIRTLPAAVACIAIVTTAAAQPPIDRNPAEMMKRADTDGDGKVSHDEFIKARTADLEAAFDRLDTSGDGKIDGQEAEAAAARMRSPGGGGREGGFRRPDGERPQRPGAERPQEPGGGGMGEQAFDRLDRDGDGTLSREEFANGMARLREFMQRGGGRSGGPGMPDRGGRGPEEGFRKPPQQD